jgi:probable biosynthetic protein (TIGR04099 family)
MVQGRAVAKYSQTYLLSMPQLSLIGLSEHWLLKQCGHQHWMALAEAMGLSFPEFKDESGTKIYPAFLCVSCGSLALNELKENDVITLETELFVISKTRTHSRTRILMAGSIMGEVSVLSSFVCRQEEGNNQSVARANLAKGLRISVTNESDHILSAFHMARNYSNTSAKPRAFEYIPCPYADFNGADFLYFAAFQTIADRSENNVLEKGLWSTVNRTISYFGNVNLGDRILVSILKCDVIDEKYARYRLVIQRQSDMKNIAIVEVEKQRVNHPSERNFVRF